MKKADTLEAKADFQSLLMIQMEIFLLYRYAEQ